MTKSISTKFVTSYIKFSGLLRDWLWNDLAIIESIIQVTEKVQLSSTAFANALTIPLFIKFSWSKNITHFFVDYICKQKKITVSATVINKTQMNKHRYVM